VLVSSTSFSQTVGLILIFLLIQAAVKSRFTFTASDSVSVVLGRLFNFYIYYTTALLQALNDLEPPFEVVFGEVLTGVTTIRPV
jgi:hypothetical protein